MNNLAVLAALAARLNRQAGRPDIPSLYFMTDPARTPDPIWIAGTLPPGATVVYRHFGAPDRGAVARELKSVCRERRLKLLIGADVKLAERIGADGVHWPERLIPRSRAGFALETGAAHGRRGLIRASVANLDACLLSPIFPSHSASAGRPLGPHEASRLIHAVRALAVIALGGVNAQTARRLSGRGFAGLAAIDAFLEV